MMTRARGIATLAAATAAVGAAACALPERPAETAVIASGADLESANPLVTVHPLSRQVQRHALFVTLARYDSLLRPEPYWARRWVWSDDRRTLTFVLEPRLRWHDGTAATARDAAFTLDAARDPAVGFPRASDLAVIANAAAPDDTTLVVRFSAPQPDVPSLLVELPVVPRHLLDTVPRAAMRRAAFSTAPVGSGPFRFVSRDAGERWVFARNDDFPASMGGPPRLARLVVAVVDEATTKFAGLVSGELDAAGISPTMASLAEADPMLRVVSYPTTQSYALVFNTQRPPFDDARVRKAVSASLDRPRIIEAALAGYATPAFGPVPPSSPLALPAENPRDTVRADALLDAAGWRRGSDGVRVRGGRPLAVELATVGSGDNPAEQLIQSDLAARGIRVSIRVSEMGAFLTAARAPRKAFDMLITGIPGDLSLAHLAGMFASSQAGGALDYSGFHAPAIDDALARASRAATEGERRAAWADVQRALAHELPVAWVYHARGVQGLRRRLAGVTMDLRGELATVARWSVRPEPTARERVASRP